MRIHQLVLTFDIQLTMVTCKLYIFYVGWVKVKFINFNFFFVYGFIGLICLNIHKSSLLCLNIFQQSHRLQQQVWVSVPDVSHLYSERFFKLHFLSYSAISNLLSINYKKKTCLNQFRPKFNNFLKIYLPKHYFRVISFKYKTGYLMDCL